ncbi:radical SAM protein [Natranaerofaba carboxydovora]|uniref:radical SAM protein n=1 Tax=Natranaerofaba carboxydovora TaxID=2742683 RepID=UPI001F13AAF4|nr:radical SAM protein [Natranaerofaba carboxydovora]UMZ74296.1 Radical SAM superfamily protein [Natranaerofaba carboxydovora]
MIRISAGTAYMMGLKKIKIDETPTTGYLMLGEGCANNCAYCAQSKDSYEGNGKLSRVTWPKYDIESLIKGLKKGEEKGLKRLCIQEVKSTDNNSEYIDITELIKLVKKNSNLPVSLSSTVNNLKKIEELLNLGVDKIGVSLDVCSPEKYPEYKSGLFSKRLNFIKSAARKYPGKISTHLIVGLGESDYELLSIAKDLVNSNVNIALFAFTPLQGTRLSHKSPPTLERYRKIQAVTYLLKNKLIKFDKLLFDDKGKLVGIDISSNKLIDVLSSGQAFITMGCSNCNRPFYNEKPHDTPFNYPRNLSKVEKSEAIKMLLNNLKTN